MGKDFLMFKVLEDSLRKGSASFFFTVKKKMLLMPRDSVEAWL